MRLVELAETSGLVAGTRSRIEKRALIAALLASAPRSEIALATAYLSGTLPQRRTGLGWRGLVDLPAPATEATLTLTEVDRRLDELAALAGPGSAGERTRLVRDLFDALTSTEQDYLRSLLTGAVRQGALDSVVLDAIATAANVPLAEVRRAAMFSATSGPVAYAALTGGTDALRRFTLEIGRPVRPMLASSAPGIADALAGFTGPVVVDTKLDGIRIQVHKEAYRVRVYTRSLEEISERLPAVVAAVRVLPADRLVLDGEALLVDETGRARPFQETSAGTASTAGTSAVPFFFDLLAHDDETLIDDPGVVRWTRLDELVPASMRTERLVTGDADAAAGFFEQALAAGHEGVIVKDPSAPYAAGRRGAAWVKVKPRHTLDLVVLAVEWGSGRRRGLLSNIHLGARSGPGQFVMLGKTFKGMTDEMLAWQTERFLDLETHRDGHVVHLRPEQVVEVAFDGVQRSSRYPGGVALRFARVLRYREDKLANEADTIDVVRALRH